MKFRLLLFVFAVLVGCSKSSNPLTAYFRYSINGRLVTIGADRMIVAKQPAEYPIIPKTMYVFNGEDGPNIAVVFEIVTDSLQTKSYFATTGTNANAISFFYYGVDYESFDSLTQGLSINITRYSNESIDGNFTGLLRNFQNTTSVNITHGEFKNLKITH